MLSIAEQANIVTFINRTCNREGDHYLTKGVRINREPGGDITIRLDAMVLDLEPEDVPRADELGLTSPRGTSGVGYPD